MISVSKAALAQCNAQLESLCNDWDADVAKKCYMIRSRGDTASGAQEWMDETYRLLQAMKLLLENTATFFSAVAAEFEDADDTAAQETGGIGGSGGIVKG